MRLGPAEAGPLIVLFFGASIPWIRGRRRRILSSN